MKFFIASALLALSLSTFASQDVIYGDDNRLDVYAATNALHVELSRSTAAQISYSSIVQNGQDYIIQGKSLEERGICASERFSAQMTAARCSGFLVGDDILVTAGHCVKSQNDCDNYAWVFDYKQDAYGKGITVPGSSVYGCKRIIAQSLDSSTMNDYAVLRLEKKVKDREPLEYRDRGAIPLIAPLVVIGHPTGLPTKISDGANVRSSSNPYYFTANLDTYGGNSGSAVLDADTGLVEGILVRGEQDYVYDYQQGCQVSKVCSNYGCRGEDVTRITNIKSILKKVVE